MKNINNDEKKVLNPINRIKSKKTRIVVYIILVLIVFTFFSKIFIKPSVEFDYDEFEVKKDNINVIVEGSGIVKPNNQYDITALVQGEILKDYFQEGQIVKKDDLLYTIDYEDLQTSIDRAKLALDVAKNSYDTALQTANITASTNGIVMKSGLKLGQMIMAGQQVAEVLDNSDLRLLVQYNYLDAKDMYVGQDVLVTIENGFYSVAGKITKISSDQVIELSGMGTSYVEVIIKNPGNVQETDYGITLINGIRSNNSNTFEYINKSYIYATASGYVKQINKIDGDYVKAGDVIAVIAGANIDSQIERARLAYNDSKLSYENAQHQLKNYNIKAPISGKILVKNNKAGDVLSTGSMYAEQTPLAIIADMSSIVFTMKVDELDISKIEVGQNVKITSDAIEGVSYTGKVDNINVVGESINGVSTYIVKIVIDNPEGLFPGMNVDAEIEILNLNDVIVVPLSAVKRGNIVYVKTNATYQDEDVNIPKGYKKVSVETGKNDKTYIEILSGLNVGDIVLVEKAKGSNIMDFMSNFAQNQGDKLNNM